MNSFKQQVPLKRSYGNPKLRSITLPQSNFNLTTSSSKLHISMIFNFKYVEYCKKKDGYLVRRDENANYTEFGTVVNEECLKIIDFLDICLRYIYSSLNNNPVTFWITLPIDNVFLTLSINIASRLTWNCNLCTLCIGPALHNLHLIEAVTILIKFYLHWRRWVTADVISLGGFLSPGNWASSEQCWENEGHQRV